MHYKTYRKKPTKYMRKRAQQIRTAKDFFKLFFILSVLFWSAMAVKQYFGLLGDIESVHAQEYRVVIPYMRQEKELTVKQRVYNYLASRNVSDNFIKRFECLMRYENKPWDPYAIHVNYDGSYDRGLLQWNSKNSPVPIENWCAMDIECGLNEFVNYINHGGSWDRWLAYRNNCK